MTTDEYHNMREENTKEWIIEELEKRGFEKGLANFNLRTLRESLLKDQVVASRTHVECSPQRYKKISVSFLFLFAQNNDIERKVVVDKFSLESFFELIY